MSNISMTMVALAACLAFTLALLANSDGTTNLAEAQSGSTVTPTP